MIIPLNPRDILVPDTIVEVIISRKLTVGIKSYFLTHEKSNCGIRKKSTLFSREILII
jgi:hypothetical protein